MSRPRASAAESLWIPASTPVKAKAAKASAGLSVFDDQVCDARESIWDECTLALSCLYSRSSKVGNPTASNLKSSRNGIPTLFNYLIRFPTFWGLLYSVGLKLLDIDEIAA